MRRILLATLLLLAGCKSSTAGKPDEAYSQFVQAVRSAHEGKVGRELLEYFDASTRTELTARAKAASAQTGNTLPDDAVFQMLIGGPEAPAVEKVEVVEQTADAARLKVVTDGGPGGEVHMVREDGRWRIHLELGAKP